MLKNLQEAGLHYAGLNRHGRSLLLENTMMDTSVSSQSKLFIENQKGLILVVPHCAGAVLSSAGLNKFCPTVLLVREPQSPTRFQLMMQYLEKLGPEFILSRTASPPTVMRNMLRALREKKLVVGTTDLIQAGLDTVPTTVFGQRVDSPAWPARIASRLGIPIVPGFIHMEGPRIRLIADEAYLEPDVEISTQRWVSSFERWFRQYPSDWVFMLDRRWSRVLAAAAEVVRSSNGLVRSGACATSS
jgi:lauroyl/myristoyl acyltransferase